MEKANQTQTYTYPIPRKGVNLFTNILELNPEECILAQNVVVKNGIVKRGGSTKFETDEVSASKAIVGLARFYYSTASKQLLVASGTTVKYHNGSTWANVKTGLTDGKQTYFATWLDKSYIANGTDAPHSWDGSSSAALAAAPADTKQFLPYQDRLLSITGGDLTWSSSFDPATWESVANCGVRPDTQLHGMIYHSLANNDTGYASAVLLAGANGMYLFKGSDLRVPYTTGDYIVDTLATSVGCNAPRTMVWTPKGSMWLGNDRQVYLLPFNSSVPIPVGTKILSNNANIEGIENIPAGQIENACAVYHDGYYKLSVTKSGGSINTNQWWLDVDRLALDESGYAGPWFGPMTGQSISCFVNQSGNGDTGELMAGEADATVGSFVYQVARGGINTDVSVAMDLQFQSFYHPLGNLEFQKSINQGEVSLLNTEGTISVDFFDITGNVKTGDSLALSTTAVYWDDLYWDEFYWSSTQPTRTRLPVSAALKVRSLGIKLSQNTTLDTFEVYNISVKASEENLAFDS